MVRERESFLDVQSSKYCTKTKKEEDKGRKTTVSFRCLVGVPSFEEREREAEKERIQQEQWITIKHVPDREFAGNKVMEQKRGMMKSINQSIETRKRE